MKCATSQSDNLTVRIPRAQLNVDQTERIVSNEIRSHAAVTRVPFTNPHFRSTDVKSRHSSLCGAVDIMGERWAVCVVQKIQRDGWIKRKRGWTGGFHFLSSKIHNILCVRRKDSSRRTLLYVEHDSVEECDICAHAFMQSSRDVCGMQRKRSITATHRRSVRVLHKNIRFDCSV